MSIITKDHLTLFGAIVHYYAIAEVGIKRALATMVGAEAVDMLIVSEPYSSLGLRNVAKSLIKSRGKAVPEYEQFLQLVGDFGACGGVRNYIAHSSWTAGVTEGAVKPFRLDIRDGKARLYGDADDEKEWSLSDFSDVVDRLADVNSRIVQFLVANNGLAAAITENT